MGIADTPAGGAPSSLRSTLTSRMAAMPIVGSARNGDEGVSSAVAASASPAATAAK
jgi:hypothetical protein